MRKFNYLLLSSFLIITIANAQPSTEIYVFDLIQTDSGFVFQNATNITYQNPGYDNQPHFKANGELYYVYTENGQTDVGVVELNEYSWSQLTFTEGSEFSPTPLPDESGFSAINLQKDGTQLLWQYPDFGNPSVLVSDLKIGYHCWFNKDMIMAFVLGEPSTLQVCNLKTGENTVLQTHIGRSLHKIPNKDLMSFISKENEAWEIKSIDPITGNTQTIAPTLPGVEDMTWAPDGTIFMGKDSVLYTFNPDKDKDWQKAYLLDESMFKRDKEILKGITRLNINQKGDKIAIVVKQPEN